MQVEINFKTEIKGEEEKEIMHEIYGIFIALNEEAPEFAFGTEMFQALTPIMRKMYGPTKWLDVVNKTRSQIRKQNKIAAEKEKQGQTTTTNQQK
jgi:hypothetical protein